MRSRHAALTETHGFGTRSMLLPAGIRGDRRPWRWPGRPPAASRVVDGRRVRGPRRSPRSRRLRVPVARRTAAAVDGHAHGCKERCPGSSRRAGSAAARALRRERFGAGVAATASTARTLELTSPALQVVRGSYTGVWACGPQIVMNVDLEDLDLFEGPSLLGLVAHEVGHIAAGHPHQRRRSPRRRRASLDREMEAIDSLRVLSGGCRRWRRTSSA